MSERDREKRLLEEQARQQAARDIQQAAANGDGMTPAIGLPAGAGQPPMDALLNGTGQPPMDALLNGTGQPPMDALLNGTGQPPMDAPVQEMVGAERGAGMMAALAAMAPRKMTKDKIRKANEILRKYQNGKANLDRRLVEDENWWEGHAWHSMLEQGNELSAKRPTKWLANVIMGKHADMMEAYPEPVILPREKGDEQEAKKLTSILPVVLEQNDFEQVYSSQAWEKNKHGTAAYAIYWDRSKLNGLGDIAVCGVELVNLFWEPGVDDIQKSEHVFYVTAQDREQLVRQYPQLEGKGLGSDFTTKKYKTEDNADRASKVNVVDWYYHTYDGGQKRLHYCKFCGTEILYASEDDPEIAADGWYADGEYPFVLDVLFPMKGSPAGRGYIDIGKDAQESIDLLDHAIVLNAMAGAIPRYLVREDTAINTEEFLDFRKPFVTVQGTLNENNYMPLTTKPLGGIYVQVLNNKIEELKQTCGNQDVTNGITSGVTAASGIAAQMEAAGRTSRDGNQGTYRAYSKILEKVIERIRQFYDLPRTFRIVGKDAAYEFIQYDNAGLQMQGMDPIGGEEMGFRKPVFDIQVAAQKQNAYSKMAQNELALQLLGAGVFSPQLADQSAMLLSMMDFNKKDELLQKVEQNGTILQMMAMWQQMAMELAQKYEPETAEQMAQSVLQGAGMQAAPMERAERQELTGEPGTADSAHMVRARDRARNVSQPG